MKKLIIIFLLAFSYINANNITFQNDAENILHKQRVVKAFCKVESNNNRWAYNKEENAGGILQIRPCMINYLNSIGGNYKLADRWDISKSKEMFYFLMNRRNPQWNIEKCCSLWNGLWTTKEYINNIKRVYSSEAY